MSMGRALRCGAVQRRIAAAVKRPCLSLDFKANGSYVQIAVT
jgi:hypothetical protein